MSMTFANQQTLLSVLLGDSNTDTSDAFPLATRKLFLNLGEMQFCKDSKCVWEKETGTISGTSLAFPAGLLEPVALIVNNKDIWGSKQASVSDYEKYYASSSAYPTVYTTQESGTRYFRFYGSSNGQAYTLYYIRKPTVDLSSDSDTSIIDDQFRPASVYWAASELLQQAGKNAISDKYMAKYNNYVRDGKDFAEQLKLTIVYAQPDLNIVDTEERDVAGGGY